MYNYYLTFLYRMHNTNGMENRKFPEFYHNYIIYVRCKVAEKNQFNNLDDDDMFVTLDLDDGSSMECQILTIFEADGRDYIALLPVDEDEQPNDEGEVFIYRYSEDADGNPNLENIEDDEEYEIVSDRFDELLDEAEFEDLDD